MDSCHHHPHGPPIDIRAWKRYPEMDPIQAIDDYTDLVITWDPVQFEDSRHHQKYEEFDGSIAYLQMNTVKQLVSLRNYMILLLSLHRPADQKHLLFSLERTMVQSDSP